MNNSSYVRAIRGPIVLIALGILMLVDHFGSYPIWRTWPALLVVIGVMVLFERLLSRPPQPPPAYPSSGEVQS